MEKSSDLLQKRKAKIDDLKQSGINLFPNGFVVNHTVGDIQSVISESAESLSEEGPTFVTAGRMMAVNSFGKSAFIRFRDRTGQLQAYVRKDRIGDEAYRLFKQLDIGDFVGLTGELFQTRTGEWTLLVGGDEADKCNAVTTDASGNVYVAGGTGSSLDIDPPSTNESASDWESGDGF